MVNVRGAQRSAQHSRRHRKEKNFLLQLVVALRSITFGLGIPAEQPHHVQGSFRSIYLIIECEQQVLRYLYTVTCKGGSEFIFNTRQKKSAKSTTNSWPPTSVLKNTMRSFVFGGHLLSLFEGRYFRQSEKIEVERERERELIIIHPLEP